MRASGEKSPAVPDFCQAMMNSGQVAKQHRQVTALGFTCAGKTQIARPQSLKILLERLQRIDAARMRTPAAMPTLEPVSGTDTPAPVAIRPAIGAENGQKLSFIKSRGVQTMARKTIKVARQT